MLGVSSLPKDVSAAIANDDSMETYVCVSQPDNTGIRLTSAQLNAITRYAKKEVITISGVEMDYDHPQITNVHISTATTRVTLAIDEACKVKVIMQCTRELF